MAKKVTKNIIKKNVSKYNETTELSFTIDNEEYIITVYPYLSPKRINSMLVELQNDMQGFKKHGIEIDDQLLFPMINAYVIIEFSDIYSPIRSKFKNNEEYYKTKIQYIKELMDTDFYKEILETIEEKEFGKVYDKLIELKIANDKINDQITKLQGDIANLDIQNPEVRDKFQNFEAKPKRIPEA